MSSNKYFQEIDIQIEDQSENHAKIVAEPFERGYGVTIGNTLRRTLLTSIPGAAITSIKIDGVNHEFTTIKGVLEDVADIILNLKEIRFNMIDEGPELISIELQGPCKFSGVDIGNVSKQFEVLNPEKHIATITKKVDLSIDLRVSRGKGYSPASKNKRKDDQGRVWHNMGDRIRKDDTGLWYSGRSGQGYKDTQCINSKEQFASLKISTAFFMSLFVDIPVEINVCLPSSATILKRSS